MPTDLDKYDVLEVQAEYIAANEGIKAVDDKETGEGDYQTLASYFSNNKEAMNLFLSFCFLVQRVNTGGVSIADLEALNNITKSMVDDYQLDTDFLNYMISSISNNKSIYKLFAKNGSEFNHVQRQHPKRYCEIMSNYLSHDYGFIFTLYLTGVVLDDLKRVESLLSLLTKTHISELTAVQNKNFMLRSVNPWDILLNDYKQGVQVDKNSMIASFVHAPAEPSNIYLVRSLVTARKWLLRRVPQAKPVSKDRKVIERLSATDAVMSRDEFLGITPTFVSLSGNRPYRSSALNSSVVSVRDVEIPESDSEELEGIEYEASEDDDGNYDYDHDQESAPTGFLARAKALFSKKTKTDVEPIEEVVAYSMAIPDDTGIPIMHTNLMWEKVEEYELEDIYFRLHRQIFSHCALVEAADNSIDVTKGIIGSWRDVAMGYYMAVSYAVEDEDEEED